MDSKDLDPYDGGATSIERRGSEPICSFDLEAGFAINASTVDELRWYAHLSDPNDDNESLLQSRNDD
jgi:hypothetical protein